MSSQLNRTPVFAVSSWSLHHRIGVVYPDAPGQPGDGQPMPEFGPGAISIVAVPAEVKAHGFDRMELCHFHIPGRDPAAVSRFAAALRDAGVTLQTLLIDDGDIAHPDARQRARDVAWIAGWIGIAAELGASHVRVIAGKQPPTQDAMARSMDSLQQLAATGAAAGVRVLIENWFALTPGPAEVHALLDRLNGTIGFLADTGNWLAPAKYSDLEKVFARAERCHAKAHFSAGLSIDSADYNLCLDAAAAAGYQGPYTLVFESDGDEWAGIAAERAAVEAHARNAARGGA